MKVTPKFITDGQSLRGGWTKRQLEILGLVWPPKPGWRQRVVGLEIADELAKEFLSLKTRRPQEQAMR
jgi:hypothetical protein